MNFETPENTPSTVQENPSYLNKTTKRTIAALTTVAIAAGAYGLSRTDGFDDLWNGGPKSLIVKGVPGQIEAHYASYVCGSIKPLICSWKYSLEIEQSPKDTAALLNHTYSGPNYDPKLHEVYQDSHVDWVLVSSNTYAQYPDGAEITFSGNVGESLRK